MQDLTFGEQVKIILSRKDMTIKELAKKIEVRTGKKMSRQNLTQRLGRDNFQERDMRMIAEIMGCPFQLNILDERTITENETKAGQKVISGTASETAADIKETESVQASPGEREAAAGKDEEKKAAGAQPEGDGKKEAACTETEDAGKKKMPDTKQDEEKAKDSHAAAHERDITIGELVDIHEELDALLEKSSADEGKAQTDPAAHPDEYAIGNPEGHSEEHKQTDKPDDPSERMQGNAAGYPEGDEPGDKPGDSREYVHRNVSNYPDEYAQENAAVYRADYNETGRAGYGEVYPGDEAEVYGEGGGGEPVKTLLEEIESLEKTEKKETVQGERPHGWRAYLKQRFKKLGRDQTHSEKETTSETDPDGEPEDSAAGKALTYEDSYLERDYAGEYDNYNLEEEYSAGAYEGSFSEMEYSDRIYEEENQSIGYSEEAYLEELAEDEGDKGEINPYTGKEYESNSVRMHPSRIGYVQVYDRMNHQWTDMTEWAFLGYQERKKQLLGKDYDPPIYLD